MRDAQTAHGDGGHASGSARTGPNTALRDARQARGWTQQELADALAAWLEKRTGDHRQISIDVRRIHYYAAPGFFDMQRGMIFRRLGSTAEAVVSFDTALSSLPPEMQASDWAAFFRYEQALSYLAADLPDEASAVAGEAFHIARATAATDLVRKLDTLHVNLSRKWPERSSVVDLRESSDQPN